LKEITKMRRTAYLFPLLFVSILLVGACAPQPEALEKTWIIGPELAECEGEGPQLCMQVKERPGEDWQLFYGQIEGFEYEEGFKYVIRYREEPIDNPPAGGSSLRWVLVETMSKKEIKAPVSGEDLEGTVWRMNAYRDSTGKRIETRAEVQTTAEYMGGLLSGRGGCNSYTGSYEVDRDQIDFGPVASTMMACPPEVMEQESGYLNALSNASSFTVEEGVLILRDSVGEMVIEYKAKEPVTLQGTSWLAVSTNNGRGGMVSLISGTEITANFEEDGTMSGSAGCNTYSAPFEVAGETMTVGMAASTRMFCEVPDGIMEQEAQYLAALQNAATYKIAADRLEIRDREGAGVAYYAVSQSPAPLKADVLENLEYPSGFTSSGTAPLVDGEYRENVAEDSASEMVVRLTDHVAAGTVEDGIPAAAVVLASESGGSGTFFDLAVVGIKDGEPQVLASALLGDRVKVLSLDMLEGAVTVELVGHAPEDPMCCPTQWERRTYGIQDGELVLASSETLGTAHAPELLGATWKWLGTVSPDDTQIVVEDPGRYSVEFLPDGSVAVRADCNVGSGTYLAAEGQIDIEILITTMAACPPDSLEGEFIEGLNSAAVYFFQGGDLYFDMIYDSGTMRFMAG
jgi:heat shock protein HslJ